MNSLKEVFEGIRNADQQKTAAVQEQEQPQAEVEDGAMKTAADYENIGRALAHTVFEDLVKEAVAQMPEGHGDGYRHDDGVPCTEECAEHGGGEKTAAAKTAILERMASDPNYVAHLIAKHQDKFQR